MRNFICFEVIDEYGNLSSRETCVRYQQEEQKFRIGDRMIEHRVPIVLQKCNRDVVGLEEDKLKEISDVMEKYGIGCVKVPEKDTQLLASRGEFQCIFAHCGTFNYQHDCFLIVQLETHGNIAIRNCLNQLLFTCQLQSTKYNDKINAIYLGENIFYFWKELGYENIREQINKKIQQKEQLLSKCQMEDQKKVSIPIHQQLQKSNMQIQVEMRQQRQFINTDKLNQKQHILAIIKQQSSQQIQQIYTQKQQTQISQDKFSKYEEGLQRTQVKSSNMSEEALAIKQFENQKNTYKKYQNRKYSQMKDQRQHCQNLQESQNNSFAEDYEQIPPIVPVSLNFDEGAVCPSKKQQMELKIQNNENIQHKVNSQIPQQATIFNPSYTNQNLSPNFPIPICCQQGCNILQIHQKNQKQHLYYHKFIDNIQNKYIANCIQICQLSKSQSKLSTNSVINLSKIVYYQTNQNIYYNDLNTNYIYTCNITSPHQQSHPTSLPVLDMVKQSPQSILGIHDNQIFLFDTRECKQNVISAYKTVNNLQIISSIYQSYCYATGSREGFVRTYDLRNHRKAMNKFQIKPNIISLQISQKGNYMLCGYQKKAYILPCTNNMNDSIFQKKIKKTSRKKIKIFVKDQEDLTNIQFITNKQAQGNIIALDNKDHRNVIMKNLMLQSNIIKLQLTQQIGKVSYLSSTNQWLIYGINGQYYRQELL